MPSFRTASYNSSRVQHAWKINNIEQLRLDGRMQLLDKERRHRVRLYNQDMRLISLTLDYIQTSSGRSAEGLSPDSDPEEVEETQNEMRGPCFMYGERVVSRKRRRYLRPQSALNKTINTDAISSTSSLNTRPQSSPNRRKPSFVTQLRDDQSEAGTVTDWPQSSLSSPRPEWDQEPSEITKILLRACSVDSNQRQSVFNRSKDFYTGRGSSAIKALSRNLHSNQQVLPASVSPRTPRGSINSQSCFPSKGAGVTAIINQGASPMSASAWKTQLGYSRTVPMTTTRQRNTIMESKKEMNRSYSASVQKKVHRFFKE